MKNKKSKKWGEMNYFFVTLFLLNLVILFWLSHYIHYLMLWLEDRLSFYSALKFFVYTYQWIQSLVYRHPSSPQTGQHRCSPQHFCHLRDPPKCWWHSSEQSHRYLWNYHCTNHNLIFMHKCSLDHAWL